MTMPDDACGEFGAPLVQALKFATLNLQPNRLTWESAWNGLLPLAFFTVALVRPKTIVELGVHHGASYCSFCQAASELALDARCFGIDTWTGDRQAGYYDGEAVLQGLRGHHDPLYGSFSLLLRTTFDDARDRFQDGSIDLLHIDGLHTYEAVLHDFSAWLPKLSDCGVVLLHDIAERQGEFGVYRLWDEIKASFPVFEVTFGHGLGIAAVGRTQTAGMTALLALDVLTRTALQSVLARLGQRVLLAIERDLLAGKLCESMAERDRLAGEARESMAERDRLAGEARENMAELDRLAGEARENMAERDRLAGRFAQLSCDQSRLLQELSDTKDQSLAIKQQYLALLRSHDEVIGSLAWRFTSPIRRILDIVRGRNADLSIL